MSLLEKIRNHSAVVGVVGVRLRGASARCLAGKDGISGLWH